MRLKLELRFQFIFTFLLFLPKHGKTPISNNITPLVESLWCILLENNTLVAYDLHKNWTTTISIHLYSKVNLSWELGGSKQPRSRLPRLLESKLEYRKQSAGTNFNIAIDWQFWSRFEEKTYHGRFRYGEYTQAKCPLKTQTFNMFWLVWGTLTSWCPPQTLGVNTRTPLWDPISI